MNPKTLTFTYSKPNGEVSYRVGVVMRKPTDNYSMLDVTELNPEEMQDMLEAVAAYEAEVKALREKYAIDLYWKNFKESRMTDIQDWITPWA